MSKHIKHLVVDTTAFIKAANLQDIAENVYTIQEVIDEITNDRQRKKLVVLPYDLTVKDVFTENIKFVTEFSKKTGDYPSLSATDIKVMALAYQMEKEKIGSEHLKTEPTMQKIVKVTGLPKYNTSNNETAEENSNQNEGNVVEPTSKPENINLVKTESKLDESLNQETGELENNCITDIQENHLVDIIKKDNSDEDDNEIVEQIRNMDLNEEQVNDFIVKVSDDELEESESGAGSDSDSDGGEWITPGNLANKKKEMEMGEFEEKDVEVACITSDFAMQNVLKQIGLHVTSIDGRIIKQLRTFIFRCTTCFKTTSVMTKLFCPKCGHSTLRKVGVSIDEEGNQHIHINGRKPLTARGKKFSLPTPRGGQHFQYPILTEDQHIHKRFATKMARGKTNALDPDYTAGFSPFAMRDVNSKSAVLGVRANKQDIKYWMKNYSKGKKK